MIGVIDYGIGNVKSIINMFKKIGYDAQLVQKPDQFEQLSHLVLPGVGSFDYAMTKLEESGLVEAIRKHALVDKKPLLGICLGMQMLGTSSEEGLKLGLNFLPFYCKRFNFGDDKSLKVPHMGWDTIIVDKEDSLTNGIDQTKRYYFVHSFYAVCNENDISLMTCDYGVSFSAAVSRGNIYGVQFHPEKSHVFGMELLENFARLNKC